MSITPKLNELEELFDKLWPICRSITGDGISKSLDIISDHVPLKIKETKSGTKVNDWVIPKEWNINDAYIKDEFGNIIVNFKDNNLHIMSYSKPIDQWLSLDELKKKLYTLPHLPEAIPYVTSYYNEDWGFCISHNQFLKLKDCRYHVVIKSTLENGVLKYGECYLPSTIGSKKEILLSTYICHPSMANNELSGPLVWIFLYSMISNLKVRKYNYRFYIGPETIGAITFLNQNKDKLLKNCIGGFVINCCGDKGDFTFKKSKHGNSITDKCAINVLEHNTEKFSILDFFPEGSDERQYSSPGYNLSIGLIMRSMYGTYKEYHTSLDNKNFISFESLLETIQIYFKTIKSIEADCKYKNLVPYGEPNLGKRGLYQLVNDDIKKIKKERSQMMWLLNLSDGNNSLSDIALKSNTSILDLNEIALKLIERKLLKA